MRKFSFLILAVSIFACSSNQTSIDNSNLKTIKIGFANVEMEVPKSFNRTSIDEQIQLLSSPDIQNNLTQWSIGKLEATKNFPLEFIVYVDSTNTENCIWFQEGEYIRFNKSLADQYIGLLENELKKSWTPQGIEYKRLESKYFSGDTAKKMKLKYKLKFNNFEMFSTQYLIATNSKTFAVIVNKSDEDDFEKLIGKLRFN